MSLKFPNTINIDEIVNDILEYPNSILFLFGDRLQGKTSYLEIIQNEIRNEYLTFKIKTNSIHNIIEVCYLTALSELLEKKDENFLIRYNGLFKNDEMFLFSKIQPIKYYQIKRLKNFLSSNKVDSVLQILKKRYRGIDKFSLRYALFEVVPKGQKVCFIIDDFENHINDNIVDELVRLDSDGMENSFIIASRPRKELQNYYERLMTECNMHIRTFYINPYLIHKNNDDVSKISIPIIPGIFKNIDLNALNENEIYKKTINDPYYKSIYTDDLKSFEDEVICAFLLVTNGLREKEIKEILQLKPTSKGDLFIRDHKCMWHIDSEWRFIDSWREYLYASENIESLIDKSESFLVFFILYAFLYPSKVKRLDIINKDFSRFYLNQTFSKYIADYMYLVKKLAIHKRNRDKISPFFIKVIKDFLLENSLKGFNDLYDLLWCVYEETQEKTILDYILQAITEDEDIDIDKISNIINLCQGVATQWNDLTLLNNINNTISHLKKKGFKLNDKISNNKKIGIMEINKLRPFIVHGHDELLKIQLKDYLQNKLKMVEPVILSQKPNKGLTIIDKFEKHSNEVDVAFILLTEDDLAGKEESSLKNRARQNVIFELGYFVGLLGRERVIVIKKGEIEIPSDLYGLLYLQLTNNIEEIGEQIRNEIESLASKE